MATFSYRIALGPPPDGPFEELEALVDTGATYTLAPGSVLRGLGILPVDSQPFVIANGRQVELEVGQATVRIDGRTRMSTVIFGDEEAETLLGAVTLEEFGLGVDPLGKRLIPVASYLVGLGRSNGDP